MDGPLAVWEGASFLYLGFAIQSSISGSRHRTIPGLILTRGGNSPLASFLSIVDRDRPVIAATCLTDSNCGDTSADRLFGDSPAGAGGARLVVRARLWSGYPDSGLLLPLKGYCWLGPPSVLSTKGVPSRLSCYGRLGLGGLVRHWDHCSMTARLRSTPAPIPGTGCPRVSSATRSGMPCSAAQILKMLLNA